MSELDAELAQTAESVVRFLDGQGVSLDYGVDSLRGVDAFIDRQLASASSEFGADMLSGWIRPFGVYAGEVVRRAVGGEWKDGGVPPCGPALVAADGTAAWPVLWSLNRESHGADYALHGYAASFIHHLPLIQSGSADARGILAHFPTPQNPGIELPGGPAPDAPISAVDTESAAGAGAAVAAAHALPATVTPAGADSGDTLDRALEERAGGLVAVPLLGDRTVPPAPVGDDTPSSDAGPAAGPAMPIPDSAGASVEPPSAAPQPPLAAPEAPAPVSAGSPPSFESSVTQSSTFEATAAVPASPIAHLLSEGRSGAASASALAEGLSGLRSMWLIPDPLALPGVVCAAGRKPWLVTPADAAGRHDVYAFSSPETARRGLEALDLGGRVEDPFAMRELPVELGLRTILDLGLPGAIWDTGSTHECRVARPVIEDAWFRAALDALARVPSLLVAVTPPCVGLAYRREEGDLVAVAYLTPEAGERGLTFLSRRYRNVRLVAMPTRLLAESVAQSRSLGGLWVDAGCDDGRFYERGRMEEVRKRAGET